MSVIQIVIFVFVVLVLLYFIIQAFSKTNNLTTMSDAKKKQTITASSLKNTNNSTNFTYSMWIYVDDWNYLYGTDKTILSRNGGPDVILGQKANTISININCFNRGTGTGTGIAGIPTPAVDSTNCATNAANAQACAACGNGFSCACTGCDAALYAATYTPGAAGAAPIAKVLTPSCTPGLSAGAPNAAITAANKANTTSTPCLIDNIPIQAWVNVIVSLYGSTLDTYINGKLVRTCVLPGVPNIDNSQDILVTPNGGFSGWTTSFKYWANASNPQQAYNIYKAGFGGSILGNVLNKYKLRFSVIQDNVQTGSFEI